MRNHLASHIRKIAENIPMQVYATDLPIITYLVEGLKDEGFVRDHTVVWDKRSSSSYRVDFANPRYKIVIEIDSLSQANERGIQRNIRRDKRMRSAGWKVIHISEQPSRKYRIHGMSEVAVTVAYLKTLLSDFLG